MLKREGIDVGKTRVSEGTKERRPTGKETAAQDASFGTEAERAAESSASESCLDLGLCA